MNTDFDEIHSMILLNDSSISLDIIRRLDIYITEFSFGNTEGTSVLLNQKNVNKYTMLHSSIFGRNLDIFSYLVKNNADINIKCHGTPVLHLLLAISIQPESKEFALDAVRILMDRDDIEFDARDDQNATILHLIAEYNCIEIGELIFKLGNLSSLIHTKDRIGWFPLHRAGSKDAVAAFELLLEWGASLHVTTSMNTNILHICSATSSKRVWNIIREKHSDSFNSLCNQNDNFGRTPVETAQLYGFSADDNGILHSTVIVSDSLCLHHHTCAPSESVNFNSAPPENINRLKVLIDPLNGVLHASDLQSKILHVSGVKEATISDVLRVHEWSYIRKIQTKCEQIDDDPEYSNGIGYLDGDTTISKDSFNAALKAAGCVIHAIDLLVNEHSRNAFCPIRPPGHHAGPKGVSKEGPMSSDSHGFCLINNVSIGAAYALNVHRDVIKKVAIVDFDVHHGNGTEETVRWLQPGVDEFPLQGSNFFANVQTPRYKPWFNFDDSNNVFFVSVHGFGPRGPGMESFGGLFYPGSGSTKIPEIKKHQEDNNSTLAKDSEENNDALSENEEDEEFQSVEEREDNENSDDRSSDNDYNVEEIEIEEADEDSIDKKLLENLDPGSFRKIYTDQKKSPLVLDVGVGLPEATISPSEYRHRWRNYFRNVIFPSLNTFQPDIIFISAGFDGHKKDTINAGYLSLLEEDFEWVTNHLVRLANTHSNGRVVSVLEGGYQLGGGICSAFAKSVKAHVTSLSNCSCTLAPFSQTDLAREEEIERKILDQIIQKRIEKEELRTKRIAEQAGHLNFDEVTGDSADASPIKRKRSQVNYSDLNQKLKQEELEFMNSEP